ncbi:uncharacterized protein DUF3859 [Thiogranum longum]|uniref:Uncharacterized protein DUF3859 n=1 Tax=Thiogranum longum TaxID=1537524 RepID=A0A4R1HD58_9GAMM|nr:DUF3859 domain-containing protein [Thiogranum longum]TCK18611.1 uncharacterized protein DUF3859 [Thiogranum longum]
MKYLILIPIALLLVLGGCENNSGATQDGDKLATSSGSTAPLKPSANTDEPLKGHIGRPGLYRLVRSGGVINDPTTGTGKSVIKPVVEMVKSTERIPLIKGGQMYLQYRIWPLPALPAHVDLRRVVKHPRMTLPDGSYSTGSDRTIKGKVVSNQVIAYTGYGLDEDYELVEGDWIFEIWYQGKKVIEQKFTTHQPSKEELAKLKPILALGNRAVGQSEPSKKPFSKRDWPRIMVGAGGVAVPDTAEAPNKP